MKNIFIALFLFIHHICFSQQSANLPNANREEIAVNLNDFSGQYDWEFISSTLPENQRSYEHAGQKKIIPGAHGGYHEPQPLIITIDGNNINIKKTMLMRYANGKTDYVCESKGSFS